LKADGLFTGIADNVDKSCLYHVNSTFCLTMTGFGAFCSIQNGFLVHGGISKANSKIPLSSLVLIEINDGKLSENVINTKGNDPQLSHHAGALIKVTF